MVDKNEGSVQIIYGRLTMGRARDRSG